MKLLLNILQKELLQHMELCIPKLIELSLLEKVSCTKIKCLCSFFFFLINLNSKKGLSIH